MDKHAATPSALEQVLSRRASTGFSTPFGADIEDMAARYPKETLKRQLPIGAKGNGLVAIAAGVAVVGAASYLWHRHKSRAANSEQTWAERVQSQREQSQGVSL